MQSYGNIRSIYYKNISYLSKHIYYLIDMSLFLLSKQYEDLADLRAKLVQVLIDRKGDEK